MLLSSEEVKSIFEEMEDQELQKDLRQIGNRSSMTVQLSLAEYIDFLNRVSETVPEKRHPTQINHYHTVLI